MYALACLVYLELCDNQSIVWLNGAYVDHFYTCDWSIDIGQVKHILAGTLAMDWT